jgi:hypothetical protein
MTTNSPNRLSSGILFMLVIVGAILAIVGWFRYYGA